MITLIILIVLVAIGVYLSFKWNYDLLGTLMWLIFGIALLAHSLNWGLASYNYGLFVEKRNAFEQTLKIARESGNKYETAAIVKEVTQWNIKLAEYKYDNNTFCLDKYIDDRVEFLEPIK